MAKLKTAGLVIGTVLVTAAVVSAGVYLWQQQQIKNQATDYEQQLTDARAQAKLASDDASKTTTPSTTPTTAPQTSIVYVGDVTVPTGDKDPLQTKVADPFFAFYNETTPTYVALLVQTPTKTRYPADLLSAPSPRRGVLRLWLIFQP